MAREIVVEPPCGAKVADTAVMLAALAASVAMSEPPTAMIAVKPRERILLSVFELVISTRKPMAEQLSGENKGFTPAKRATCVALANLFGVTLSAGMSRLVLRVRWVYVAGVAKQH